jgi:hypothetical protein
MRTNHGSRERRSGRDWKLTVLVILFLAGVVLGLAGVVDWQKIRFHLKAGEGWERRLSRSPTYRLLERHCDVFTLCLLRILPGFPHSVINYGSGLLKVKTFPLVFATAVGFAIKGYLYAVTIYEAGKASLRICCGSTLSGRCWSWLDCWWPPTCSGAAGWAGQVLSGNAKKLGAGLIALPLFHPLNLLAKAISAACGRTTSRSFHTPQAASWPPPRLLPAER